MILRLASQAEETTLAYIAAMKSQVPTYCRGYQRGIEDGIAEGCDIIQMKSADIQRK